MRLLRTQDPSTYQRLRDEYNAKCREKATNEGHIDDDINEFIDDWFQASSEEETCPHEKFLREEASRPIYNGASISRLSVTLLILNLQTRYQWSNASVSALLS